MHNYNIHACMHALVTNYNLGSLQSLVSAFFKKPLLKPWIELRRAVRPVELLTAAREGGGGGGGGCNAVWLHPTVELLDPWGEGNGGGGGGGITSLLAGWNGALTSAEKKKWFFFCKLRINSEIWRWLTYILQKKVQKGRESRDFFFKLSVLIQIPESRWKSVRIF